MPTPEASESIATALSMALSTSEAATDLLQDVADLTALEAPTVTQFTELLLAISIGPAPPPPLTPILAQTTGARSASATAGTAVAVVAVVLVAAIAAAVAVRRRRCHRTQGMVDLGRWCRTSCVRLHSSPAKGRPRGGACRSGGSVGVVLAQASPFDVSATQGDDAQNKADTRELHSAVVNDVNGMGGLQVHTDFTGDQLQPYPLHGEQRRSSDPEGGSRDRSSSAMGQRFSCADLGRQLTSPADVLVGWRPDLEDPPDLV